MCAATTCSGPRPVPVRSEHHLPSPSCPGGSCAREEYAICAQLEPAYAILGGIDWATTADALTLTVTNGMGEGIEASLLTNLAVNAQRAPRRDRHRRPSNAGGPGHRPPPR